MGCCVYIIQEKDLCEVVKNAIQYNNKKICHSRK